jgi:ABC-type transport system involved in multi-copper enzyme maturation permease subunit
MSAIYQILGIARTEFRFGLRRGGPIVGILATSLIASGAILFLTFAENKSNQLLGESTYISNGDNFVAMSWPGFLWLALVVLPLVCASAIPSDRQYKIQELLTSTPITGWSYLAGKILGIWAVIASFGLLALLVHIGLLTALVGPIDWPLYIQLTLLCGLPLTFWSSAMGVLAGSGLRSRRLAHITGLLVGLVSIVPSGLAFRDPVNLAVYSSRTSLPITPLMGSMDLLTHQATSDYVFQQYHLTMQDWISPVTQTQVVLFLASAILVLAAGFALSRAWLAWKENF